jgi:hypothetical protein
MRCRVMRCAVAARWYRLIRQLGIAVSGSAFVLACAPVTRYRPPSGLREYQILVSRTDSLSQAVGRGLKRRGFTVRTALKGGSPPIGYLLSFTQRATEPGAERWLYVRLVDTRSGDLLAAVSAPLDSLGPTVDARAQAIVDSLTNVRAALRVPPTPAEAP